MEAIRESDIIAVGDHAASHMTDGYGLILWPDD